MKDFSDFMISKKENLLSAMRAIHKNRQRCALVCGEKGNIIGVVSMGDIAFALASGVDPYVQVEKIVKPNFYYRHDRDMDKIYQIFKAKLISLFPIVDDNFMLKDIVTVSDIFEYLEGRAK